MSSSQHTSSDQSERPAYDDSDHLAKNPSSKSESTARSQATRGKLWPKSRMGASGTYLVLGAPDNPPIYLDIRLWDHIEVASALPTKALMLTGLMMLGTGIPLLHNSPVTIIISLIALYLAAKFGLTAYRGVCPNTLRLHAGELITELTVADGYRATRSIVDTLAPHARDASADWRQAVDRIPTLMRRPASTDPDSIKSMHPPLLWLGEQPVYVAGRYLVIEDVAIEAPEIFKLAHTRPNQVITSPIGKIPVHLLALAIAGRFQMEQHFPPVRGAWSHYALPPTPISDESAIDSEGYFHQLSQSLLGWSDFTQIMDWQGKNWYSLLQVLVAIALASISPGLAWIGFLVLAAACAATTREDALTNALTWTRTMFRLAIVGHFLVLSQPVASWALLALGGSILCFIMSAPRHVKSTFSVRLGRALLKALGNSLGAVTVGLFLVCAAQFTLLFLIPPQPDTLAIWDEGLVTLQEWLRSTLYLSFPALLLVFVSLVLASSFASGLGALSHFTRIRRWGARALVVTTTIASFTFFADSRLPSYRVEREVFIEAQLLAQEHRDYWLRTPEERRVKQLVEEIEEYHRALIANAIIQQQFRTYSPNKRVFLRHTIKRITKAHSNTLIQKLFAKHFASTMPKLSTSAVTGPEAATTDYTRMNYRSSPHFDSQLSPYNESTVDLATALSSVRQWTRESPHLTERTHVTPEMIAAVKTENARLKQITEDARQVTHHLFQTAILNGMSGIVGQVFVDTLISEVNPSARRKSVPPVADLASAQQLLEDTELQENRRRQVSWERLPQSQAVVHAMADQVAETYISKAREQERRERATRAYNPSGIVGGGGGRTRSPSSGGSRGGGGYGVRRSRRRQPVLLTA